MDRIFPVAILLVVCLILLVGLTPYGTATSPDALRYLEVARSVDAGDGLVLPGTLGDGEPGLVPFTTYPPLYPLVLSLFVGPDERAERSAARLAIVMLFFCAIVLFELLRPAIGIRGATGGVLVFLLSQTTLTVFTYAWSESLAIPLLLCSLWCSLRCVEAADRNEGGWHLLYLTLLTAGLVGLVYTRYIAVLFSIVLPLTWLATRPRRRLLVRHVLAGGVVALSAGALYLRNLRLTGFFSGSERVPSTRGIAGNVVDTLRALKLQVDLDPVVLAAAGALAAAVALAWWNRGGRESSAGPPTRDPQRRHLLHLCWACAAIYLAGLLAIRSMKHLDPIDTRFIAPAFTVLLIPVLLGIGGGWRRSGRSVRGAVSLFGLVILICLVPVRGITAYQRAVAGWALDDSPNLALSTRGPYYNYNRPSAELVDRAQRLLERKLYRETLVSLRDQSARLRDDYAFNRIMATAYSGMGNVASAVEHTRACLAHDRDRALTDIVAIGRPYWESARLYPAGIDYYEQLKQHAPDAWWVYLNIGNLADRLGLKKLAAESLALGSELRDRGPRQSNDRSIILVVVDTLRADHLGVYGHRRPTSPELDLWARSGRLYERAYATSSWTLPSFGSIYTGLLPERHRAGMIKKEEGSLAWDRLHPGARTLAEILAARGYTTAAIVNNPYLDTAFGTNRGFADYDYFPAGAEEIRRADLMVDRSLSWIDGRPAAKPFLLVVHLFDPHMSYDPPADVAGRFTRRYESQFGLPFGDLLGVRERRVELTQGDRRFIAAAYDEEILFVDAELGRFRRELASRGLLDETIVIVTSDHGEELFEHGGFEHGHALWEEVLRVPLLIWGPGVQPGREPSPVSIADIAPTLLEGVGLVPEPGMEGLSLWPNVSAGDPLPERTLFAEGSLYGKQRKMVLRGPHKLVVGDDDRPHRAADLGADPAETRDLVLERPAFIQGLMREHRQRLRRSARGHASAAAAEPDAATLEKLRSLGYVR